MKKNTKKQILLIKQISFLFGFLGLVILSLHYDSYVFYGFLLMLILGDE